MWVRGLKLRTPQLLLWLDVAPYVGAWIETFQTSWIWESQHSRTLCGCVDWNFNVYGDLYIGDRSHPMWVRGLKLSCHISLWTTIMVAPYVGAWIETLYTLDSAKWEESHPMWVRGLKQKLANQYLRIGMSHPMWVRGLKQFFVLTVQSYKPKPRIIVLASNIPI